MELVEQLALNGHRVHAFTLCPPKSAGPETTAYSLHHVLPWSQTKRHAAALYREWNEEHYAAYLEMLGQGIERHAIDILHYHYAVPFAKLAADIKQSGRFPDLKIVGTLHGTDVTGPPGNPVFAETLRASLLAADRLTTVSSHQANLIRDRFRLNGQPLRVIRNFVDLSKYDSGKRLQPSGYRAIRRSRILHVSNFRPVKRPEQAVQIFATVRRQVDAELCFAGDGPTKDDVIALVRERGLDSQVRFLGLMQDVSRVLANGHLLLVTSQEESFCLAALEAMAMGIPVLAPTIGGLPELIEHGVNGLLYPPDTPKHAAREAIDLLTNPEKWQNIAAQAVKRAARFKREDVVAEYEALYADMLGLEG